MNTYNRQLSTYEDVAIEYYDAVKHPTCANFSELSTLYLTPRIRRCLSMLVPILEVGAGRSTAAPVIHQAGLPLEILTLLDNSPSMLEYSREWSRRGSSQALIRDACQTELPCGYFGLIVSALGDPYNCPKFWQEVARLLKPGGVCLFTTPAAEWAMRFRKPHALSYAEFLVNGAYTVLVPSSTPPLDQQVHMIAQVGLEVIEVLSLSAEDLTDAPSPKLLVNENTKHLSIVRGFTARRT